MPPPVISDHVTAVVDAATLIVTIDRPKVRNALDPPTAAAIGALLDWCENESQLRATIITGAGTEAFCAGFDLKYAEAHPEVYNQPLLFSEIVRREGSCKPMIAAVNGLAFGLGFELALACDIIVAAAHASFCLPEPKVGLCALGGGIVRLVRDIGLKPALGIVLAARPVSAADGHRLGFVHEIVSEGTVIDAARGWSRLIGACGPLAIMASKQLAYESLDKPDLKTALDPRQYSQVMALLASPEPHEGRRAFLERRKAAWIDTSQPAQ